MPPNDPSCGGGCGRGAGRPQSPGQQQWPQRPGGGMSPMRQSPPRTPNRPIPQNMQQGGRLSPARSPMQGNSPPRAGGRPQNQSIMRQGGNSPMRPNSPGNPGRRVAVRAPPSPPNRGGQSPQGRGCPGARNMNESLGLLTSAQMQSTFNSTASNGPYAQGPANYSTPNVENISAPSLASCSTLGTPTFSSWNTTPNISGISSPYMSSMSYPSGGIMDTSPPLMCSTMHSGIMNTTPPSFVNDTMPSGIMDMSQPSHMASTFNEHSPPPRYRTTTTTSTTVTTTEDDDDDDDDDDMYEDETDAGGTTTCPGSSGSSGFDSSGTTDVSGRQNQFMRGPNNYGRAANATYSVGQANPNATYSAGQANPNATYNAGRGGRSFRGACRGAANAGGGRNNRNATFAAAGGGGGNATYSAGGGPNATYNAGRPNATYTAPGPNATYTAAGGPNATYTADRSELQYAPIPPARQLPPDATYSLDSTPDWGETIYDYESTPPIGLYSTWVVDPASFEVGPSRAAPPMPTSPAVASGGAANKTVTKIYKKIVKENPANDLSMSEFNRGLRPDAQSTPKPYNNTSSCSDASQGGYEADESSNLIDDVQRHLSDLESTERDQINNDLATFQQARRRLVEGTTTISGSTPPVNLGCTQ